MKKILVLNPNTSELVTQKIASAVKQIAHAETTLTVAQIDHGPVSLESFYDEALAAPFTIEKVKQANAEGYDAIILAAFCDPSLEALKEISDIPVYGIAEGAYAASLLMGNMFGILTEKKHKEAVKRYQVRKYGLECRFAGVKALDMGVVEIAADANKVKEIGFLRSRELIQAGAEVIILGCASMAGYAEDMERELRIPVIDPVSVTFKMVEGLIELKLRHSKIGLYSQPAPQKMN
jgi:allantoin racemase